MKRIYATLAILALGLTACAHSQQPPSPVAYTCSGNYTELNAPASNTVAASIAGASYTWSPPSVGAWCVILQSWGLPAGQTIYQVSVPSNVAQVTTTTSATHVNLTWTQPAPTSMCASYTYILSYAAATPIAVPTAPLLNTPTTSQMVKPALPGDMPAPVLAAKLVR
jgi:hypothetical protein